MARGGPSSLAEILNSESEDEEDDNPEEEYPDEGPDEGARSGRVFALDHCRQHGSLYAFQIAYAEVEPISIRINTDGQTCSSDSCREDGDCHHIAWLLDHLSRAMPDTLGANAISTYDQISNVGLENVCEELYWEVREGPDSDTEDTWQLKKVYPISRAGRQTRGMIRERMNVVRDIMATLSPQITDDYRKDIFERLENISPKPVIGDLEATLSRVLLVNDEIFHHFKTLISHNMRAKDYFRKALIKAQATCEALDKYCELGPVDGEFDLIWCANELTSIVGSISVNIIQRQPLNSTSKHEAARALVGILSMVVRDRNHDCLYAWKRQRKHAEPSLDRNLYVRLIRTPLQTDAAGESFVLYALQDLPEAQPFIEELQAILERLGSTAWDAPLAYREKLQKIIAQLKGVPVEPLEPMEAGPRASSSKRSSAGSGGRKGSKRMK